MDFGFISEIWCYLLIVTILMAFSQLRKHTLDTTGNDTVCEALVTIASDLE